MGVEEGTLVFTVEADICIYLLPTTSMQQGDHQSYVNDGGRREPDIFTGISFSRLSWSSFKS